jgi:hypothetical protein
MERDKRVQRGQSAQCSETQGRRLICALCTNSSKCSGTTKVEEKPEQHHSEADAFGRWM